MTKGNYTLLNGSATQNSAVTFQIINNGALIVDNTPGALAMTISTGPTPGVSSDIAAWVAANELDGITGPGSIEQRGALPLVLGSPNGNPNSYTGGTTIDANAAMIVASSTAFGAPSKTGNNTVQNAGVLSAAVNVQTINIPGNYSQTP